MAGTEVSTRACTCSCVIRAWDFYDADQQGVMVRIEQFFNLPVINTTSQNEICQVCVRFCICTCVCIISVPVSICHELGIDRGRLVSGKNQSKNITLSSGFKHCFRRCRRLDLSTDNIDLSNIIRSSPFQLCCCK